MQSDLGAKRCRCPSTNMMRSPHPPPTILPVPAVQSALLPAATYRQLVIQDACAQSSPLAAPLSRPRPSMFQTTSHLHFCSPSQLPAGRPLAAIISGCCISRAVPSPLSRTCSVAAAEPQNEFPLQIFQSCAAAFPTHVGQHMLDVSNVRWRGCLFQLLFRQLEKATPPACVGAGISIGNH